MDLRVALGHDGKPSVSSSYASALKNASGVKARKFDINAVIRWLRNNPDFKMSHVYKRKAKPEAPTSERPCNSPGRLVSVADTSRE